jgi:hypothetical protein
MMLVPVLLGSSFEEGTSVNNVLRKVHADVPCLFGNGENQMQSRNDREIVNIALDVQQAASQIWIDGMCMLVIMNS